ncbi:MULTISPECIES: hypothetical protein [unclassified Nostoc]|nr:hypothetical protein [Nostoc sp. DedQUE03]MDZ7973977.1 hypothetical protein [Nostoc sp. DedQUE03]MDZ8045759.1 hypothetical protein [Nostoc sp. DedQUE02]
MLEKTSTFQKTIEAVEALDPEAREAYAKREVRSGTVADLMAELDD